MTSLLGEPALLQSMPITPALIHAGIEVARYFVAGCAILAIGSPVVRLLLKRFDRPAPTIVQIPPELAARLERIEQGVEAVAIEVERIAEAQRFSAKLLAERQALPPGAGSAS
jgi:hypothetical protein